MLAITSVAISPVSVAVAQESGEESSEENHGEDKSYEGKDGKPCGDKKKDRSETMTASGNQA